SLYTVLKVLLFLYYELRGIEMLYPHPLDHLLFSMTPLSGFLFSKQSQHLKNIRKWECREEQFPCTRLYSVHKPVKQCISYLCVTSVRRMYIINKEVCSRVVCKEDEVMQDEICRQLAGLPPRRLRRSGQPRGPPCRWGQNKELNKPDAL
uniref:Microfibril associated protein 5 n=1 Tax=Gopherus evgoodei TaxID=1825980 RepID=A0A8C4VMG5_9SAUR